MSKEINCSFCGDDGEYCPHCQWSKAEEDGERAMDFNKGN